MAIIQEAFEFANEAHKGQVRKYDGTPYIRHPLSVMGIMTGVTSDEVVLAATLLHDTVEDCEDVNIEVIHEKFGEVCASYVFYCTEKSKKSDGSRAVRKEIDRRHYSSGSCSSQNIKLADMIDNMPSIVQNDPKFGKTYMYEKLQLLASLQKADVRLQRIALSVISDLFKQV